MYVLPKKIRDELQEEFKFDRELDSDIALFHPMDTGRLFINPIPPVRQGIPDILVNKALKAKAELVVLLLPCDTSTDWFHKVWDKCREALIYCERWPDGLADDRDLKVEVRFFKGRIKYEGRTKEDSRFKNRVPSCLIIVRNGA